MRPHGDEASVSGSFISSLNDEATRLAESIKGAVTFLDLDTQQKQSFLDKVLEVTDYEIESHKLVELFLPYSVQSAVYAFFGLINVAVIGFYLGVQAANVYIVVGMLSEFTSTFTYGFSSAIGTLAPQADGAGNRTLAGQYLQMSIVLYTLFSLPSLVIWAFCTDEAVLWFGFDEDTAKYAQRFVYPYMIGYLFGGLDSCLFEFLDVMGHEKYATVVYFIYTGSATLILVLMLIVGEGNDLVSVGIAQSGWGAFLSMANFGFIVYKGWLDDYWEGLVMTNSFKDRRAVRTIMMTAIPLSIAWILTYGEWEVLTIFARFMGPAEVAAWGLLGYVWEVFEQVVTALGSAVEVRIGFLLGAGMHEKARMSANKAIYMGVVLALVSTGVLFTIADQLPTWLTPDPTLQYMVFQTLPLVRRLPIYRDAHAKPLK